MVVWLVLAIVDPIMSGVLLLMLIIIMVVILNLILPLVLVLVLLLFGAAFLSVVALISFAEVLVVASLVVVMIYLALAHRLVVHSLIIIEVVGIVIVLLSKMTSIHLLASEIRVRTLVLSKANLRGVILVYLTIIEGITASISLIPALRLSHVLMLWHLVVWNLHLLLAWDRGLLLHLVHVVMSVLLDACVASS